MEMKSADRLRAASRASAARAIGYAERANAGRLDDTRAYLREVYRLCALEDVALDASIVVAQSQLETFDNDRPWNSKWWKEDLNPAGIGITSGGPIDNPHFRTGQDAARGHIVHLYLYAVGEIPDRGHSLSRHRHLDTRYEAAVEAGRAGVAPTISRLAETWAEDQAYATKIVARARVVFSNLPDQSAEPTPTHAALDPFPFPFDGRDKRLDNGVIVHAVRRKVRARGGGKLRRHATLDSPEVRRPLRPDEEFEILYAFEVDGRAWYYTRAGARVLQSDCFERVRVTVTASE
ncbi:MAG: hypothetical protein H0W06_01105 [Chloroflexia bacterium]|nr:hypothetical protein [Chloroflexia bacterium]